MGRKRTYTEMETSEPPQEKKEMSLLQKIRNMWEFACVMQYIFIFGKVVKIDEDFDIEDFENECLRPEPSQKLEEIGLTLLKWISSHRGLNYDIWDEYTRRQYVAKAPHLNPYGEDEEPKKFRTFDIFQKIRVLHQLTVWTFWNPDRMRERMPDHQREVDQLEWRVEEFGYDSDDRNYYLLDDNRLYRRTEPPLPPLLAAKPKSNTKKAQAARRRASKRRRILDSSTPEIEEEDDNQSDQVEANNTEDKLTGTSSTDSFGGYQWECVAITLGDYQELCDSLKKSRDPNEKAMRQRLLDEVTPIIEAAEDKQRRKIERRERELLAMEKMAHAKRSSRIADKLDRERREQEVAEAERKHAVDLANAHREKERQDKMEAERQSRMMTREQRIKDREYKRILKEEELARDAEEAKRIEEGQARGSERQLKERIEKNKKELESLNAEEEWTFDCAGCGIHGKNIDDGSHSVACEKCNVWQHSKCLGISKAAADKDDFHFVCRDCKQKEEDAKRPKISLKFKVGPSSSPVPSSPAPPAASPRKNQTNGVEKPKHRTGSSPSQDSMANGYRPQLSSSPPQAPPNPHFYHSLQNGYPPYGYNQAQQGSPPNLSPNTQPPYRPGTNAPGSPPDRDGLGYGTHANGIPRQQHHTPGLQWVAPPSYPTQHSAQPRQPPQYNFSNPYHSMPPQPKQHSNPVRPPMQETPRPVQSRSPTTEQTPSAARLPSPIINRPIMTPSQGNYDVGPVAGIPQKSSPVPGPLHISSTPISDSSSTSQQRYPSNGPILQATPTTTTQSHSPPHHLSGISPTKQPPPQPQSQHPSTSPLPPSSNVPMKISMSPAPPPPPSYPQSRSVSGTPIFPPIERLAPSPSQLNKSPVPTPSKQPTPAKVGGDELRRISQQIVGSVNGAIGNNARGEGSP